MFPILLSIGRPRLFLLNLVLSLCAAFGPAQAAIVVTPPGQSLDVLEESALIVFDPLAGQQSILVRHKIRTPSTAYGMIFPVPTPAQVYLGDDRVFSRLSKNLNPKGRLERHVDVQISSWIMDALIVDVGRPTQARTKQADKPAFEVTPFVLGKSNAALHNWLLQNGMTISPAQRAWLDTLARDGWSFVSVLIQAKRASITSSTVWGPVVTLAFESDQLIYSARHPSFALTQTQATTSIPLTVGVLSEWPVLVDTPRIETPFFAQSIPAREVRRIAQLSQKHDITFRRDGFLTAFEVSAIKNMVFIVSDGQMALSPLNQKSKSALRQSI